MSYSCSLYEFCTVQSGLKFINKLIIKKEFCLLLCFGVEFFFCFFLFFASTLHHCPVEGSLWHITTTLLYNEHPQHWLMAISLLVLRFGSRGAAAYSTYLGKSLISPRDPKVTDYSTRSTRTTFSVHDGMALNTNLKLQSSSWRSEGQCVCAGGDASAKHVQINIHFIKHAKTCV